MKLLIVTQTIDTQDPILGFFVRWVEEFAKNCEEVHVLALNVGSYTLPDNVKVHCLGKSEGKSKIVWLWRLWRHSFGLRHHYDATFVHMNPEYVLYGGVLWRLMKKRIGLWYTHGSVPRSLSLAQYLAHTIFTASPESCRLKSRKVVVTGHGIDIDFFSPGSRKYNEDGVLRLIAVGRIAPIKRLDRILEVVHQLKQQGVSYILTIVGSPLTAADMAYESTLRSFVATHALHDQVVFVGAKTQMQTRDLMRNNDVLLHASETGSLDKVVLEARATGLVVVEINKGKDVEILGSNCEVYSQILCNEQDVSLQKNTVIQQHSLPILIRNLITLLQHEI